MSRRTDKPGRIVQAATYRPAHALAAGAPLRLALL